MQTVTSAPSRNGDAESVPAVSTGPGPDHRLPRATTVGGVLRWGVAALLLGAAGIHFAMMGEHAGVSWSHGLFFGVTAWLQVALALAVIWRPSRVVLGLVVVVNLAILTVWIVTRTVGIAIGGDGSPEAWGAIDGVCAALEGLAILGSIGLLVPRFARRPLSAGVGVGGIAFVGVIVAALVTFVFSPSVVDAGTSADGHNHGGNDVATPAAADGAAALGDEHSHGPVALNGQKITGVKAADIAAESQPDKPLDPATRATLKAELTAARDLALRYPTVADATAAGFYLAGGFAPGSGAHYIAPGGGLTAATGPFDPTAVNSLIYAGTAPTSEITGLMYYSLGDEPATGFAGPNDHWHRHSNVCLATGINKLEVPFPADADVTNAQCERAGGRMMELTGWMVHAWVVPSWESPQGVFSHDNSNVRCGDGTYKTDKAGFCQGV